MNASFKKRPLSREEMLECQALNAIYKAKKKELGITQEKIALEGLGATTQSAASHYLTGKNSLNAEAAAVFARYLQVSVRDFSPRLADEIEGMAKAVHPKPAPDITDTLEPIHPWDDGTPLDDDEVEIPFYKEVEMAAGAGRNPGQEIKGRKLRFSYATLRAAGVDPAAAICTRVGGNSMEPLISDGATIGVDTATKHITDGEIYAIKHDDLLRVKFVYRLPGGGVRLRSYNRDEYPDEEYTPEEMRSQQISVIGWVFWWSVVRIRRKL
ncbi:TPA: helix-turn-helix transcriptional regulator [Pseudomonas aeruginosa]|nr:helix-turn-helix transcriptional regulator [Pseudomonas aeruginosa]HBO9140675.1 helix-turn-helix transcriptional regulator [Pseudomonas aeruginosa]HBP5061262.1 helix-turn-helix transcriptional regulator [Pseudomonas aeruginosa]